MGHEPSRGYPGLDWIGHPEMYGLHDGADAGHRGSLYLRYIFKLAGFDASTEENSWR